MKRYLVFAFNDYYPQGGAADVEADCDTLDEATALAEKAQYDNSEVLDTVERRWIRIRG